MGFLFLLGGECGGRLWVANTVGKTETGLQDNRNASRQIVMPPSTLNAWPVAKRDSSPAR